MSNTKTTQTTSPKRTYNKKKDTVVHMDSISFRIGDSTTKTTLQPAFQKLLSQELKGSRFIKDQAQVALEGKKVKGKVKNEFTVAKTWINRLSANWLLEIELLGLVNLGDLSGLSPKEKRGVLSHYYNNKFLELLLHKSLINGYIPDAGFINFYYQKAETVLLDDKIGQSRINLHSGIVYCFEKLAEMLNVEFKDICNYFVWLYSIHYTDSSTGELIKNGYDTSCNYRDLVIMTLNAKSFNFDQFKSHFEIFLSVRKDCILAHKKHTQSQRNKNKMN